MGGFAKREGQAMSWASGISFDSRQKKLLLDAYASN